MTCGWQCNSKLTSRSIISFFCSRSSTVHRILYKSTKCFNKYRPIVSMDSKINIHNNMRPWLAWDPNLDGKCCRRSYVNHLINCPIRSPPNFSQIWQVFSCKIKRQFRTYFQLPRRLETTECIAIQRSKNKILSTSLPHRYISYNLQNLTFLTGMKWVNWLFSA